jgi:predicted nucleic acid-binding Zn ribbon protein
MNRNISAPVLGAPLLRRCLVCDAPVLTRGSAKFCSDACRVTHFRRRARLRERLAARPRCAVCRKPLAIGLRTNARFCSAACRQAAYRSRRAAKAAKPKKAHQRVIKDRLATVADQVRASLDIRSAIVRKITIAEARAIIAPFEEPLRALPAIVRHCFGIFFGGQIGGAVVYTDEASANLQVWRRYGYDGKIICLARGACLPWAHPHSGSKLVRGSMALLPKQYQVITALVDRSLGERGVIYRAAGFDFVGIMTRGGRAAITLPDGTRISERTARRLVGTGGARALARMGFDAVSVPRRERVFAFRGTRREQRALRESISALVKPYPK